MDNIETKEMKSMNDLKEMLWRIEVLDQKPVTKDETTDNCTKVLDVYEKIERKKGEVTWKKF